MRWYALALAIGISVCASTFVCCSPAVATNHAQVASEALIAYANIGRRLKLAYLAQKQQTVDMAPSEEAAIAAVIELQSKWEPIADACESFESARNNWLEIITRTSAGLPVDLETRRAAAEVVRARWCELIHLISGLQISLPEVRGLVCGENA